MFRGRLCALAAGLFLSLTWQLPMAATGPALNPDHPDQYEVREGDTLWDIAQAFLRDPWRWQEIWRGNPQVKNPDLIYPGDVLYLAYEGGQPVVRMTREGRPVVKLSPRVRRGPIRSGAIPAIPVDAIKQFLASPKVVEANELEEAAYIVSLGKEHIVGGAGSSIYARGLKAGDGRRFTVFREGPAYVDPEFLDEERVLGFEATHVGDAVLVRAGDPSTLTLTSTKREVLAGDRLLPATELTALPEFMPEPPAGEVKGSIISVVEGVAQIGRHQIVALNVGTDHGVDIGSVLAVYQRGETLTDELALDPNAKLPEPDAETELDWSRQRGLEGLTMTLDRFIRDTGKLFEPVDESYREFSLPDERAGTVMVFKAFGNLSYALVMAASRPMHIADVVTNP
ncbi:MAG: LysM domain-containing protein [Pseudomonadota bacterium]